MRHCQYQFSILQIIISISFVLSLGATRHVSESLKFQDEGPGDPLYLTPMIKAGEHEKARESSLVPAFTPLISYSGFITVNEEYGSNLFFWYFPAETSYNATDDSLINDIPVILWLEGGPGASCIVSIFNPVGPFTPIDEMNYIINPLSWHRKYHMIFVDNPVQVGFSHTSNENGYAYTSEEVAKDTYKFLQQFFQMFPHLKQNPFYNMGTSYGAKFASEIAHLIHNGNMEDNGPHLYINLTGIIVDSPFLEVYSQGQFANTLFGAGLINKDKRDEFLEVEATVRGLIEKERWAEAAIMFTHYSHVDIVEATGFVAIYDMVDELALWSRPGMIPLITLNSTRKALHVGNTSFELLSRDVQANLLEDNVHSSAGKLDELLNNGYKFLVLLGNTDVITGHAGIRRMFEEKMSWEGSNELVNGNREIWRVNERVAGYISRSGKAEIVIVRNAGHGASFSQPGWVLEVLGKFLGE